jgi:hypothetical protein
MSDQDKLTTSATEQDDNGISGELAEGENATPAEQSANEQPSARFEDLGLSEKVLDAVRRAGFDRFMANVLIACANTRAVPAQRLLELLKRETFKEYPLARAMLVWALAQLLPPAAFVQLRAHHLPAESHPWVRDEWQPARQKEMQEAQQKC